MPDTPPENNTGGGLGSFPLPVASILWLIVTVLVFVVGTRTVSLQDQERFVNDVQIEIANVDDAQPQQVTVNVISGTFAYNVSPVETRDLPTGTFTSAEESPAARTVFEALPETTEVEVTEQELVIRYGGEVEPEAAMRSIRNPVNNLLENGQRTVEFIQDEGDENVITVRTSEPRLQFGEFVAELIPPETTETYANREEGLDGSPLAQTLFTEVTSLESLTIEPTQLVIGYREGGVERNVVNTVEEALNEFYPRASLQPDLWLTTVGFSSQRLLSFTPFNTGIPLYLVTFGFALLELALAFVYRDRDEKLFRPIVRVLTVFFFFWSLFGHEPFWDYVLSLIFPTSRQLVHPNGTVIEFTAQHLELVIVSSLITIPSGLFFGILVTREQFRELLPLVNNLVNSGQTVPTIAIVAFMAPIIGFGFWPAIVALIAYGLLPVVRNTIAGMEAVDTFTIDSARGMGMTPSQILFGVELPIASRIIMAGVRTSMVVNVGTATLGAFVGSGGLGTPIASGLSMTVDAFILLGALPAAILAILVDYILDRIEFVVTPKGLQVE